MQTPSGAAAGWQVRLTVAHAVWLLVLLGAGVLRLTELGALPLGPAEASEALAAYAVWRPEVAAPAGVSPGYVNLTALAASILGTSEAAMRLVPAVVGMMLAALPWWLRPQLGNVGALSASLLLASSPILSVTARTAGGDSLALCAILLLATAVVRYGDSGSSRWVWAAGGAVALGGVSSPLFYTGGVTLGLALALQQWVGPRLLTNWRSLSAREQQRWLGVTLGAFVAAASLLLWRPAGLGEAADLLATWLWQFGLAPDATLRLTPLLALGRYEPALALGGAFAIMWAAWRGEALGMTLVYWLAGGLIFLFLQGGVSANSALVTLPGYLLLGLWAGRAAERLEGRFTWLGIVATLVLAGLLLVSLGRFARLSGLELESILPLLLALVLAGLGFLLLFAFNLSLENAGLGAGMIWGLLLMTAFINWGNAWWLSHQAAHDPRERWTLVGVSPDAHLLRETLQAASYAATGSASEIDLISLVDTPVLRWLLRDFTQVRYESVIPAGADPTAVLAPTDHPPALSEDMVQADYIVTRTLATDPLPGWRDAPAILRWWFFHDSSASLENETLTLWLKRAALSR